MVSYRTPESYTLEENWIIKDDFTICPDTNDQELVEVVSPILSGSEGLTRIARMFGFLNSYPFKTNSTCGLHVHVSLGWDKNNIDSQTLREISGIQQAIHNNAFFFDKLVEPYRLSAPYCKKRLPEKSSAVSIKNEASLAVALLNGARQFGQINRYSLYNFEALKKHGTVEFRGKEAANYVNALGYIRFLVAFVSEAVVNPKIKAADVLDKYFDGLTVAEAKKKIMVQPARNDATVVPSPNGVLIQACG